MAFPKRSGTKRKLHADDKSASESESDDVSESLSDIDDAEIAPYLNSKKEAFYKRIIWEAMNNDSVKGKGKQARKPQKTSSPNKAVKISAEMDDGKKRSSKINYEILKNSNEEDVNHAPDFEESSHGDVEHSNDKFNSEAQSFGDTCEDEFDNENAFSEEAEGRQGYEDDDTYFANDDYNEYGYEDEYGFD
ncbi:uncharacterized protein LOC126787645 isoform X2 [Argentina anserina]|uniref:uncharacterized protein LOC126787645 isoform X2 n=1 Tax=Argentina anserina TaxID=57926 RepID=UPI0021768F63|nr:uncharacterized protein LOC126787645 isoform X2 [Potentilla anserina]